MNTFVSLLIIASILVATESTTLRGGLLNDEHTISHRRLQESTCTLYKKCVTHRPTAKHPYGYHEDSWVCELSDDDSKKMGAKFVDIVETGFVTDKIGNLVSGEATLTMSEAIVDTNSPRMFIPHNAKLEVTSVARNLEDGRRLAGKPTTTGTLNTLVIRVLDSNNLGPSLSHAKLQNDVFYDNSSLKSQTEACSYNKLQIQPFSGKTPSNKQITNGVVDVKMDYTMGSGASGLDQAAMTAAREQLGDLNDSMFDLILFCFPPGNDFVAFAYPNSKYSFYSDEFCGHVTAQMHEVGHNLGLAHSGQINEGDYGDATGFLGAPPLQDDIQMCYNPQKNYQLGWYDDQVASINPLDGVGKREFILNGVADYRKNTNALVVLRLEQTQLQTEEQVQQDFYLGFNRATGMNSQVHEDKNKVTIVRKDYGAPDKYGQSTKIDSLSPGERAFLENFNGERTVEVHFVGITNGNAKIVINDPLNDPDANKCSMHTVEIMTDSYPGDTSWKIVDEQENIIAQGSEYKGAKKLYSETVCLTDGQKYEFRLNDAYGDGMCCSHGEGFYRVTDECGSELVYGGNTDQGFKEKVHAFTADCTSNPTPTKSPTNPPTPKPTKKPTTKPTKAPTKAPTQSPTKSPTAQTPPATGSCEQYTVEIKTDGYPGDNSWYINDSSGNRKFGIDSFNEPRKVHTTSVCLNYDSTYEFVILDEWRDGMCCKHGDGYYKVKDSKGALVLDSTTEAEKFEIRKKTIVVGSRDGDDDAPAPTKAPTVKPTKAPTKAPTTAPTKAPTVAAPVCEDTTEKFKLKNNGKSRSCKFFAKKNKCNKKSKEKDMRVWKLCPVSCNRCDDL